MQKNSAARLAAPAKTFRPVLVRSSTPRAPLTAEAEVHLLRAELAQVQQQLRELAWATSALVRSMV